ncbi:MAG: LPS export ABC transporter periplasmic protein LptC [Crocinitomicaceae bacterium]|nr:LPS export ABC transporter periplasmic protein LptC [Crocinitomicaceae bacterium]
MKFNVNWLQISSVIVLFVTACTNDLNSIKKITYDPKSPNEVSINLNIYYADEGYAKVNIFAAHAETYNSPHITYIKDSLKVDFYDDDGTITSSLTAKYGEVNHDTGQMFVRDSVKLVNYSDKRTMYTSVLYWNQTDSLIYTDQNVRLISPKGKAYGTSFKAKQDFTSYKITNPRGAYEFDQD